MGLRKDLDSISERYVYYLINKNNGEVIYVGTAKNPKQRYITHLKKIKTENALIYKFCREKNIPTKCKVVEKITGTYTDAEKKEIEHILLNSKTVLNFYNNPNKENYYKIEKSLKNK